MALTFSQVLVPGRRVSLALALVPALMGPALTGCGQKGPLVLPPAAAASSPSPSPSPSPASAPAASAPPAVPVR